MKLFANPTTLVKDISAKETDMILDIGCGNGRILRRIASSAKYKGNYVGVDLQKNMLKQFEKKIIKLPQKSRSKIQLIHGKFNEDIAINLEEKYGKFDKILLINNKINIYFSDIDPAAGSMSAAIQTHPFCLLKIEKLKDYKIFIDNNKIN